MRHAAATCTPTERRGSPLSRGAQAAPAVCSMVMDLRRGVRLRRHVRPCLRVSARVRWRLDVVDVLEGDGARARGAAAEHRVVVRLPNRLAARERRESSESPQPLLKTQWEDVVGERRLCFLGVDVWVRGSGRAGSADGGGTSTSTCSDDSARKAYTRCGVFSLKPSGSATRCVTLPCKGMWPLGFWRGTALASRSEV